MVRQKYVRKRKQLNIIFPTKSHNLGQESPLASPGESISLSLSLCMPFIFLTSFITLLSNNESVSLKRGNNKALMIT